MGLVGRCRPRASEKASKWPLFSVDYCTLFDALLLYPPEADSPGCFVLSVCEPSTLRVSGKPTDVGCACRANYLGYRDNETVADGEELERIASLGCWHRYVAVDLDRHGHVAFDPVRCCGH